jgi:excisionase family DNA binding protein
MLTINEIATEAKVSAKTVRRWTKDHIKLRVYRFGYRTVRVAEKDWLEFQERKLRGKLKSTQ